MAPSVEFHAKLRVHSSSRADETVPGGAANCAMNLVSLGANVSLVGVVGEDAAGGRLWKGGDGRSGLHWLLTSASFKQQRNADSCRPTPLTRQQVIRLDYEGATLNSEFHEALRKRILEELKISDAV